MNDAINTAHYLSLVGHKIQLLLHKLELYTQRGFPSQGPIALAEVVARILSRSFDELVRLASQVNVLNSEDIINRAGAIHRSTILLVPSLLEAISQADVKSSVGGIIDAYTAICNQAQFGTRLTIYPKWEYNASYKEVMLILRKLARYISPSESDAIFEGTYPYHVIITYPASEEDAFLRQAVIAHEVGHFIDYVRGWSSSALQAQIIPGDIWHSISSLTDKERTLVLDLLGRFSKPWISEIVADTIATCIMGPAYIFALEEFAFITSYDRSASEFMRTTHPPMQLRLSLASGLCKRSQLDEVKNLPSYSALTPDKHDLFEDIYREIVNKSNSPLNNIYGIRDMPSVPNDIALLVFNTLVSMAQKTITHIEAKARATLTELWTCGSKDILHSLYLQDNLSHLLLPTMIPDNPEISPSFAAIMNSGWFYVFRCRDKFLFFEPNMSLTSRANDVSGNYLRIQQLVAKAVESLNFQHEFQRRTWKTNR